MLAQEEAKIHFRDIWVIQKLSDLLKRNAVAFCVLWKKI
jgi:hypothetical protein